MNDVLKNAKKNKQMHNYIFDISKSRFAPTPGSPRFTTYSKARVRFANEDTAKAWPTTTLWNTVA
jgi:hypothetical protein